MLRIYVFLLSLAIGNCFAQGQEKETLYFEHAGHSLTEESRKTIDLLLQRTSLEKIEEISLSGHTDSDGSDSVNMKLSRERVGVVKFYLIERGVSQNKIHEYYYAKTRPIASNATDEGKQKNRRVEIILIVFTSEKQPSNEVANADRDQVTSSELPCSSIIHQTEKKVLYFNSGKHELTTSSLQVILDELEKLRNFHLVRIELAGHTDSDGPDTLNINLSKERAGIVERYLLNRNLPFSKINSSYFGESKPIASNATGEGKRKNRRVEMLIRYDECASDDHIVVTSQEETTSKKIKEPEKERVQETTVQSTPGQENPEVTTDKRETNDLHQDTNIKQKEVEPIKDTPIQILKSSVKTDSITDRPEIEPHPDPSIKQGKIKNDVAQNQLVTSTPTGTVTEQQKTNSQQPDTVTNLTDKIQTADHPVTSTQTSTQTLSVEPTVQIQEVSRKDTTTMITPVTTAQQTTGQEVISKTEISNTDTISNTVKHNDIQVDSEPTSVNNVAPTQPTASTDSSNSIGESTLVHTQDSPTNQPVTAAQEVILKPEIGNTDTLSNNKVKHNDVKVNIEPTPVNNFAPTEPTTPTDSANRIRERMNPTLVHVQNSITNQPVLLAQENTQTLIPTTTPVKKDSIIRQPPPIERTIAEATEVKNIQMEITIEKDTVRSINDPPSAETIKNDALVQTQSHTLLPNEALTITGDQGTVITFPENSLVDKNGKPVTGEVTVNLEEVYNKADMITHDVQTSSDGKLLESGGMARVEITTKDSSTVFLKPGSAYEIQYPAEKKKEDMQLFTGNSSGQNWEPEGINDSTFNENKQSLDKYVFKSSKMGWTNVDRFIGLNESHRSNLKVGLTGTPDASVCLVFKKINSVLNITNKKSEFMFYNIPTGEEVTLVAFAKSGDQILYASKNITVSKNQNEHLTLETLSAAEFQQRIKEFN